MATNLKIVISAVDQATNVFEKVENRAKRLGADIGRSITGVGQSMTMAVSLPIVGTLGLATKQAIDFESSMAQVAKTVDGVDIKRLEADLMKMTRTIPQSAKNLSDIAAAGGAMGVAGDKIIQFTEDVAKASVALDISAEQAGDAFGKLSNIFGIPINKISDLAASVNYLDNNMAAKSADIVQTLSRIGGTSKVFGLAADDAAALSATMLAMGRTPEVAATGLNALMSKMMTATIQSKDFKEGLQSIGYSAEKLEKDVRTKGKAAIIEFLTAIQKLPKETQGKTIARLFGAEYADDISLLIGGLGQLEKSFKLVQDRQGAMNAYNKEFATRSATTANQLQLMQNALQEIAINIGAAILPALNGLVGAILPVSHAFADFAKQHPGITKVGVALAALIAIIPPIVMAAGAFLTAWSTITAAIATGSGIITAAGGIIGVFGMAIGAIVSPIGIAIAAIAAIAAAAFLIIKNWGAISGFFTNLWAGLVAGFQRFQNDSKFRTEIITKGIMIAWQPLTLLLPQSMQQAIQGVIAKMLSLPSAIGAIFQRLQNDSKFRTEMIVKTILFSINPLSSLLPKAGLEAGMGLAKGIVDGIKAKWNEAVATVSGLTDKLRGYLPKSPSRFGAFRDLDKVDMIGTLVTNVRSRGGELVSALGNTLQRAGNQLAQSGSLQSAVAGGGGGSTITYNPTYNINGFGKEGTNDLITALKERDEELLKLIDQARDRRGRGKY